ncbi:hypothetical protein BB558_005468 [Smittium angustum]|uniref:Uncharacterized protein n=1 Tax=Smittium angustum TaxID=133377 RepID=A0A2U1J0E7_SMIAN|nr:hypothetical protein BB558_005468 [Smittium angustum]
MEINVGKSGYIGPNNWNLKVSGQLLPKPEYYEYLGLPIISGGIDWGMYIKKCALKAGNTLKFLQVKGDIWHPSIRLSLYKSVIRSQWEYAGPLLSRAFGSLDLKPLEEVQIKAIAWILGCSKNAAEHYTRLVHSITGLETVFDRLETLSILFVYSYRRLDRLNPLLQLVGYITDYPDGIASKSFVGWKIHYPPVFRRFIDKYWMESSLSGALYERKVDLLSVVDKKSKSDRIRLITRGARHPVTGADVSMYIGNKYLSMLAFKWRLSTIYYGTKCKKCRKNFTYKHARGCYGIVDMDQYFDFKKMKLLCKNLSILNMSMRLGG